MTISSFFFQQVCQPMDMRMIDYWIYSSHARATVGSLLSPVLDLKGDCAINAPWGGD